MKNQGISFGSINVNTGETQEDFFVERQKITLSYIDDSKEEKKLSFDTLLREVKDHLTKEIKKVYCLGYEIFLDLDIKN